MAVELMDNFIITLVNENIIPKIEDHKIIIKDSFRDRQIVFSHLYELGFNINDNLIQIQDTYIEINFSNLSAKTKTSKNQHEPITSFIFNQKHEILCQNSEGTYFSKDYSKMLCLYHKIAEELIRKKEYKNCFILQLKVNSEKRHKIIPMIKLITNTMQIPKKLR
ncbi:MAG: hypothetical protein NE330_02120 [Lentisphaeraceae bacterium]|nr:hypothetical protein [Lentisphaeraceae bacterium]